MVGTSCTLANQAVKAPPKAYPRLLSRWEVYGTATDDIAGGGFNRAQRQEPKLCWMDRTHARVNAGERRTEKILAGVQQQTW